MNLEEKKKITLPLIETFNKASQVALDLRRAGLKKEIKSDNKSNQLGKRKRYYRLWFLFFFIFINKSVTITDCQS